MKFKVMRPIPGTGYGIGEEAIFTKEQQEQFAEYLIEGTYIETATEAKKEQSEKPTKPSKK